MAAASIATVISVIRFSLGNPGNTCLQGNPGTPAMESVLTFRSNGMHSGPDQEPPWSLRYRARNLVLANT